MSNVIVVGCGRVGSQLANMLSDNGSNVCVIDRSADAFANLGRNFNGSTLQGVGFDEDTLVKAGVDLSLIHISCALGRGRPGLYGWLHILRVEEDSLHAFGIPRDGRCGERAAVSGRGAVCDVAAR